MITMHPGEYIKEAYLLPSKLTCTDLANAIGVSVSTVTRVVAGKSNVTANMAWRLQYALGRSALSWMNMQTAWDLQQAELAPDVTSKLERLT